MQSIIALVFAALAVAAPANVQRRSTDAGLTLPSVVTVTTKQLGTVTGSPPSFDDSFCTLEQTLFPGQPLHELFGFADVIGALGAPPLKATIGAQTVEDLDGVADELCVDAQQEPNAGNGICQFALAAINDFIVANAPDQAAKYRCMLNFLCVAPTGFDHPGTCQTLLAGADCVANRLAGVMVPECTS